MSFIYNFFISFYGIIVFFVSKFDKKAKLWIDGRKHLCDRLQRDINPNDMPIWFHAASLGEFEQGRPIIEKLRISHPKVKILLTFYSPSGYEVRKNYEGADWTYYLPLDTKSNAQKFVDIVNPSMAIFIKYEFWPNIIEALNRAEVNTIVISAIFREDQIFFRGYGSWMRKSLNKFSKFFVQDDISVQLLNSIGISNVIKSGDTRFDRVMDILENDNSISFVEDFKGANTLLVAGSTWPDDDKMLLEYVNSSSSTCKVLIAPHNISAEYNKKLVSKIAKKTVLFSEMDSRDLSGYDVFILDTVGLLTKVYSYADIAYVGGGFGKDGIHNILEPAVFTIPVITGPIFHQFKEAVELEDLGGMIVVESAEEFILEVNKSEEGERHEVGKIAFDYIKNNSGAQDLVLKYISENML
ncbi:MAG: 3-deoxy-D-manno-octulosonic acid transferase [Flavobacteriales bacterium]|nr:3-deoxy-D-manno-octulosonic acid transferase [Flavobacteriales bacterium]